MPIRINPKPHKYRAIKTQVDGIWFHSKREAKRYSELRLLEKEGEIHNLKLQRTFRLIVNDFLICKYIADFTYTEDDKFVVEDSKGFKTPRYNLQKKLMFAIHNIEIKES